MNLRTITLLIALALFTVLASGVIAAPEMEITNSEFYFGIAPQHAKLSHVFWIKSVGDDTLKILNVIPGCGCTKAPIEKSELAPGDSTRLEVIFSSRNYTGRVTKSPKISTNISDEFSRVTIYTQVVKKPDTTRPIVVMPYKLDLSERIKKEGDRVKFAVKNVSDKPVKLKIIDQPEDYWVIDLPDELAAGETVQVNLVASQKAAHGYYNKSFTIEVDNDPEIRFSVPVKK